MSLHRGGLAHPLLPSLPSPATHRPLEQPPVLPMSQTPACQKHSYGNTAGRGPKFDCYRCQGPTLCASNACVIHWTRVGA